VRIFKYASSDIFRFLREQALAIIFFVAMAVIFLVAINHTAENSSDEELRLVTDSVRKAVVSCYAIEGQYPDSYEYLKENYGLSIDESKYIIHYDVFASNIMPDITVIERG
jgi:hypothetical protein